MLGCLLGASAGAIECTPHARTPASIAKITHLGDITLADGRNLRLAGILWPPAGPQRRHAIAVVASMMQGQAVRIAAGQSPDRWGRFPAHIVVERADASPLWVQGQLLEDGIVHAWPEPSWSRREWDGAIWQACDAEGKEREMLAREGRLGVWSALGRRHLKRLPKAQSGGARLVYEGRVRSVRKGRSITFINFQGPRGKTPTLFLTRGPAAEMLRQGRDPATIAGKRIRLRAEIGSAGSARLYVSGAQAIEILE